MQSVNYVYVKVNKAFEDEITTPSGLKLYKDTRFQKEHSVSVSGIVHSIPQHPKSTLDKRVCNAISEGDEVCFSFRVIADIEHIHTLGFFTEVTHEEDKWTKKWINANDERVTKVAFPTSANFVQWVGVHTDKFGEVVSGVQGNEHEVDRWLSQFSFMQEDKYRFKNLIGIDDIDVWKVRLDEIYAKRTPEGDLVPVGDRLLMKPIDIDVKHRIEIMKGISLPQQSVLQRFYDRAEITHNYPPLNLRKGDIVAFAPNYVEKYQFFQKEYFVLKPSRVLGKWERKQKTSLIHA